MGLIHPEIVAAIKISRLWRVEPPFAHFSQSHLKG
jgi:hypothetical protein